METASNQTTTMGGCKITICNGSVLATVIFGFPCFLLFVRNCSGPLAGDFCCSKLEEISEALVKLIKRRISSNDMRSFSIHVLSIRHTIKGILWS
jgi:hypothetical protein